MHTFLSVILGRGGFSVLRLERECLYWTECISIKLLCPSAPHLMGFTLSIVIAKTTASYIPPETEQCSWVFFSKQFGEISECGICF